MNKIVLGLGFGDCGKGLVTDYLCSQSPNSLVVRFNGGHQAGHTVVKDGIRHVFSNFGSGTLRGVPTYWSKFCTVEPVGLLKELTILKQNAINPTLYIDDECPITTPYDIVGNRTEEEKLKHGSCGVGFGATINREEKFYSLKFIDLFYPAILNVKLTSIRNFYGWENAITEPVSMYDFISGCSQLVNCPNIHRVKGIPKLGFESLIFEGAQGLLLDQHFGVFPNVTRSNTGSKNVLELLVGNKNIQFDSELFLITRAYQTRHGNGFMTNEGLPLNFPTNPLETNKQHDYQGTFRRTLLDLDLLRYSLDREPSVKSLSCNLVITCLDQIEGEYKFTDQGKVVCCSSENDFVSRISKVLNIYNVYLSHGDESSQVVKWER